MENTVTISLAARLTFGQLSCIFENIGALHTQTLPSVVISKNFNKGGSAHNHAHSLGVAQLKPRPYFQRWKHDNLV